MHKLVRRLLVQNEYRKSTKHLFDRAYGRRKKHDWSNVGQRIET